VRKRLPVERWVFVGSLIWAMSLACADGGTKLVEPASSGSTVTRLVPARTVRGDTVRVEGSGFGADEASSAVLFAGAIFWRTAAVALSWSASSVTVLVPADAVSGTVSVRVGDVEGSGIPFSVAPRLVSYAGDLLPVFTEKGCVDCHSGDFPEAHLHLDSAAGVMRGDSDHGPVVISRDGSGSILVLKISSGPPFGSRMPLGCTQACLDEAGILEVSDWIDQGARDN
jgi:hypothetical protein